MGDNQIRIGSIIEKYDASLVAGDLRRSAKGVVDELTSYLEQRTQRSADVVREHLCGVFSQLAWAEHRPSFLALLGPMVGP